MLTDVLGGVREGERAANTHFVLSPDDEDVIGASSEVLQKHWLICKEGDMESAFNLSN